MQNRGRNPHLGACKISVRRSEVLLDSFRQLRKRTADQMRAKLQVHFVGEPGVDASGLTREWYTYVCVAGLLLLPGDARGGGGVPGA